MIYKTLLFCYLLSYVVFSSAQNQIDWNPVMNVAASTSGNQYPRVVVNRAGNPLVIWNHANRCMFSRWTGSAFTTPVLLNPLSINVAGASWMGPDIASEGDTIYVVFKRIPEDSDTCHIYCVHSFNGGISFSAPVRIDYIADSLSRFPTVTTDDTGNPIVGFMKFNSAFGNARWVVAKSTDFGNTFSVDIKASGWSGSNSMVCECCPGSIACTGASAAMVYRDNNSNIRDDWAGISNNTGASFTGGIAIDSHNWYIPACPASGPDGVIVGDTLWTTFMNGVSGMSLVYYNKSSIPAMIGSTAMPLTGTISGLTEQNYPRIATGGNALGIVWTQRVNGNDQCVLRFTDNIVTGLGTAYDTVDLNNVTNCDIAISNGNIYIVWEDDNSGTVRYRSGTFTQITDINENESSPSISVFPNPTTSSVSITSKKNINNIRIVNLFGQIIYQAEPNINQVQLNVDRAGVYFIIVTSNQHRSIRKLIVSK